MIKAEVQWLQRNDLTLLDYDAKVGLRRGIGLSLCHWHWQGNNPGSRNPHCRLLECRLQNAVWLNASKIKKWVFHEFNSSIVINKCLYRFLPLLFLFFITLMQSIPKKNAELRDDILPQIYYYFNAILIF